LVERRKFLRKLGCYTGLGVGQVQVKSLEPR
jgi:hypothetical protein